MASPIRTERRDNVLVIVHGQEASDHLWRKAEAGEDFGRSPIGAMQTPAHKRGPRGRE